MSNIQDPPQAAATLPPMWTPTNTQPPVSTPTESLSPAQEIAQPLDLGSLIPVEIVTPLPHSSDIAGWQRVETKLATFWLPASYEIIDLGDGFGELFGAFFEDFAVGMGELVGELTSELSGDGATPEPLNLDDLNSAFEFDFLIATDEDLLTSAFLISQPREQGTDLDYHLHDALNGIEGDFKLLSLQAIEGAKYEMGRALLEVHDPELQMMGKMLIYVILGKDNVWTLSYQTASEKFDQLLPTFEKSADSFEIKP
ncbi:MAG: hypothetical protein ABUK16_12000 [Anaerolineales bacterium]